MGLRCPNCKHVGDFTIGCNIEVEFDAEEKRSEPLDDVHLEYGSDTYCVCVTCGHRGYVHEFRECYDTYVPDVKAALKCVWECVDEIARVNDALIEKDDALAHRLRKSRWRMCELLRMVEAHIKKERTQ